MKPTTVYVLKDPRDGAIRYVGKTVQPLKVRLGAHIRRSSEKKTHRDCWIAGLLAAGYLPTIKAVECVPAAADWQARERHWIAELRRQGAALTNITPGGDGIDAEAAAAGWTDQRRRKQSERTAAMNRARKGAPWTEERRRLQSEAQKRRWSRPDERTAARKRMTSVCADPSYRAKQAESVSASWSAERRAKQSALATVVNSRPEKRAQQSALAAALRGSAGRFSA